MKKILIALVVIILLVPAVLAALILTLDPNLLKPQITRALARQHVEAQFNGNLSWRFYPVIGVEISDLQLANADTHQPLVTLGSLQLGVNLPALLQRRIHVQTLLVHDSSLQYQVAADGTSNWDALRQPGQADKPQPQETVPVTTTDSQPPEFAVEKIDIRNLQLTYADAGTGSGANLDNLNLLVERFSLDGEPFTFATSGRVQVAELPTTEFELSASASLNLEAQQLRFGELSALLSAGNAKARLISDGDLNWGDPLQLAANFQLTELNPKHWAKALQVQLPPTANADALTRFNTKGQVRLAGNELTMNIDSAQLDTTPFSGRYSQTAEPGKPVRMTTEWQIGVLNLDDYLPPPSNPTAASAPPAEPQPLPLDAIRNLNLQATVKVAELLVAGQSIKNMDASATVEKGIADIKLANAVSHEGTLQAKARFDARQPQAKLDAEASSKGLNIGAVLTSLAGFNNLSGTADTQISLTSSGATDQQLTDNLKAVVETQAPELLFNPVNLEQQVCKVIALVEKKQPVTKDWARFTELKPITVKMHYEKDLLTLERLSAEIQKLGTGAQGQMNLASGAFDFPIDISLANYSAAQKSCAIVSDKWRNRSIPLRCKGNINEIGIDTCLPDMKRIGDMAEQRFQEEKKKIEDQAEAKAKEEREKAKDRADEEAKKLLEKQIGKDKSKDLEETVKNIFNR